MVPQKWLTKLVIGRHGQSLRNVAKAKVKVNRQVDSYAGGLRDMDTELTEIGERQADVTGESLARQHRFDIGFSSPYRRALQTTQRLLAHFSVRPPVILEERNREIKFGVFDGLTWDTVKLRNPEEHAQRERDGKYWYRPPGGESRPDVGPPRPQLPRDTHARLS
jgi:broad specificity phosphatase PhoE